MAGSRKLPLLNVAVTFKSKYFHGIARIYISIAINGNISPIQLDTRLYQNLETFLLTNLNVYFLKEPFLSNFLQFLQTLKRFPTRYTLISKP